MPSNVITMLIHSMSLSDRVKCALVCKGSGSNRGNTQPHTGAHSIILRDKVQDLSSLQAWFEKHGGQVRCCSCMSAMVNLADGTALSTGHVHRTVDRQKTSIAARLLHGRIGFNIDSTMWDDIASATKRRSLRLYLAWTASASRRSVRLTALPDLEQLTWHRVRCGPQRGLSDSKVLRKLT